MKAFELWSASSYESAARALAAEQSGGMLVKAGGIDVLDRMKEGLDRPLRVLNIQPIGAKGGRTIEADKDGGLKIGALATLAQVAADERIRRDLPALAEACGIAATPQIRNVATIGGNLCQKPRCWYYRNEDIHCFKKGGTTCFAVFGDNRYHAILGAKNCHIVHPSNAALPLSAAGATIVAIKHADGKLAERLIPIDDFYAVPEDPKDNEHTLTHDELVREIRVPKAAMGPRASYLEIREKQSFDWPLVSCAVNLNNKAAPRVVLGAVAPIPWRLKEIESMIAGKELNEGLAKKAGAAAAEGAEPMTCNKYKVALVSVVVQRALLAASA